jgi:hypothetical protein
MIPTLAPFAGSAIGVGNAAIPKEGPKAVPYQVDFTARPAYSIDLQFLFQQQLLSIIQVIWVDNSASATETEIFVSATQQAVKVPANYQGYFPILSPAQGQMVISGGTGPVVVILINVPMTALGGWSPGSVAAPHFLFDNAGNLKTADQGLAPIIDPTLGLLVRSSGGGGGGLLNSVLLCDLTTNDGNQHDLFNWDNTTLKLTITGARLSLLGGTTAGALRKPRIYFDSGSSPVQTIFDSNVWVPTTTPDHDIILLEEYNLNVPINTTANYGEFTGDVGFSGVTGSGWCVQLWGAYSPK